MSKSVPFLDCCGQPVLEVVKAFATTDGETISIRRCAKCGCHWYYHMKEYYLSGDDYDRRAWYVRLSPEEADTLVKSSESPAESLFADRDGIERDENGIRKSQGIPGFLQ
ncbi:MAG: hypothetical protein KJ726_09590 [Verrucomicrobia bacterium]|nr:hypothetical protein [Verrucomicrobiota bacterium]MBU1910287.1 hypothetical protein [Verrucomicrobiota bacterium]